LSKSRYIVGIDLGTTNCVLSYIDTRKEHDLTTAPIDIFLVPQLVAPGEIGEKDLLPSFIYLPTNQEKQGERLTMSWNPFGDRVVGAYAKSRGTEVPGRLVASAKSWLCHTGIDRTAPILPVDAPEDVQKLSPIVASASYLRHLKAAWNHTFAQEGKDRLEEQSIYLTIPASFDAVARELTVKAASSAGLDDITLLEEPQAAFYAWLHACRDRWKKEVGPGDLILVCDIGGGTTDFSLIRVTSEKEELGLERVAVGDHILLGGDNMDLALAYSLSEGLKGKGIMLDYLQMQTLWYSARMAKEKLLANQKISEIPVVIPGRGSGLVGGTLRTALMKKKLESLLFEGFFPACKSSDWPQCRPRIGLQEMGLPYVSDTAITRHLARFLDIHKDKFDSSQHMLAPTAILFNGGVLKPWIIRRRILDIISQWLHEKGAPAIKELDSPDLDLAVAQGASYYGLVRREAGLLRIRGGIARSYYMGIEGARPAVPGLPPTIKALCVVPQGMEEGGSVSLQGRTFGLIVGQPVEFRFLASTIRPDDSVGDLIDDWDETIEPITTLKTSMEASELEPGTVIPVQLEATVTEIGTLALSLVSKEKDLRFDLEFSVRG